MDIKILGTGCAKCQKLEQITREAVASLGLDATIDKVTDPGEIASWGVMTTPALVVDDRVVAAGRVPSEADLLTLGMFEQNVVNSAVLAIVITAFITSYATRFFASRVSPVVVDRPPIGQQVLLDARGSSSEISSLVAFAGGLARPDGGLVIPFGVTGDSPRSDVRAAVDRAAAEAAADGLDGDGMLRVGDSFTSATINLVTELDASLVLLAWDGPKWAADYLFGNDIDGVGQASPVPTIAAHLIRPWNRIIVQLGQPRTAWQREDVELTADVVRHLREGTDIELIVLCDDESMRALLEHEGDRDRDRERVTVITDRGGPGGRCSTGSNPPTW